MVALAQQFVVAQPQVNGDEGMKDKRKVLDQLRGTDLEKSDKTNRSTFPNIKIQKNPLKKSEKSF